MSSPPAEPPPLLDRATQKTYERALGLLSFQGRSARQLEKRLIDKGEPAAQVAVVIARLTANGLLDDTRFAAARARAGIVGKARSRRRMVETLVHDGVARDVAEAAIQRVHEEEGTDEVSVAVRAARKKLRSLEGLAPPVQRQKLYGFLARQGYPSEAVRRALREVLDPAVDESEG